MSNVEISTIQYIIARELSSSVLSIANARGDTSYTPRSRDLWRILSLPLSFPRYRAAAACSILTIPYILEKSFIADSRARAVAMTRELIARRTATQLCVTIGKKTSRSHESDATPSSHISIHVYLDFSGDSFFSLLDFLFGRERNARARVFIDTGNARTVGDSGDFASRVCAGISRAFA